MKQTLLVILSLFFIASCGSTYELADVNEGKYRISETQNIPENQEIVDLIEPYKKGLTDQMNEVINTVDISMTKAKPESTLGNWMTDLLNEYAIENYNQDISLTIQNYGGIRINSIPKGPLQVQKIYEIMPFDNDFGIITMNGDEMMQLLQKIANSGGWPVSHQLSMTIDESNTIQEALLDGKPISPKKTYNVALSDYIAFGGDSMDFLKEIQFTSLQIKVRDAMIHQIKERNKRGENETASLDNRIKQLR